MLCYGHKITSSNPVCVEITDEIIYPVLHVTSFGRACSYKGDSPLNY